MAAKHLVRLKSSDKQIFMADHAVANSKRIEQLKGFGEQIFVVDEAVASMSMLCRVLSSSRPLIMNMATKRTAQLKSSDEQIFEVDEAVASESVFVKHMIEAQGADRPLDLNVSSKILSKVIEYCTYHVENRKASEDKSATAENAINAKWDANFVSKFDQSTLFGLMLAANDLRIASLLDLVCQTVADMITGKSVEEIRKLFNIENDFTPEEEEKFRNENKWAFET